LSRIGLIPKQAEDKTIPPDFVMDTRQWHESKEHIGLFLLNQKNKPNGQKLVDHLVDEFVILTNGPD
jgi:hypothetical protein